jgi:hypothetical protein
MMLQEGDGPANGRRRASEAAARSGQAAFVEGGDKHLHRFNAIHI